MRIVRFFLSLSFSLLFSTICMRLLTAAVTFTANCNSCHKIFHGTPLPTTYTSPTPMVQQAIGMRNKGNCCKLSCSHVETLKKIPPPFPPNSNKVAFFRLLISLFVVVVVAFVVIFIRLLCLFSNSIISFWQRMLLHSNSNWGPNWNSLLNMFLYTFFCRVFQVIWDTHLSERVL